MILGFGEYKEIEDFNNSIHWNKKALVYANLIHLLQDRLHIAVDRETMEWDGGGYWIKMQESSPCVSIWDWLESNSDKLKDL